MPNVIPGYPALEAEVFNPEGPDFGEWLNGVLGAGAATHWVTLTENTTAHAAEHGTAFRLDGYVLALDPAAMLEDGWRGIAVGPGIVNPDEGNNVVLAEGQWAFIGCDGTQVDILRNGAPGIVPEGEWDEETTYDYLDAVSFEGSSWVSLVDDNLDNQPDESPDEWMLLASIGESTAAANVTLTPAGGVAATNVQIAIEELDTEKAPLASPVFTGNPTAPTPSPGDNDTSIATTGFVKAAIDVVLGGVSAALDTLSEIATALGLKADKSTTLTAGGGLTGGGDLSANRTFAVGAGTGITVNADDVALDASHDRNVAHSGVTITAGAGLTGGGDISATRTLAVGAGTGITVNADDVALNTAHARNVDHSSVTLTAGNGLTGGGDIQANRTFTVGAGTGITVNTDDVALDTSHDRNVAHSGVTITAGAGLTGGGDISATRTLNVGAGTGITVNTDDVALDASHDRNVAHSGVTITAGAGLTGGGDISATRTLNVGAGTGIAVNADDVALANMAESTIKGRAAGAGTGAPTDLSAAQATAILNAFVGDSGSGGTKGIVPAPATGDSGKFLKGDGSWATIPGGGDMLAANNLSDVADKSVSLNTLINGATAETAPAVDDYVGIRDTSATAGRKMTIENFLKVINALTEDTAPDQASDFVVTYDASASLPKKAKGRNIGFPSGTVMLFRQTSAPTGWTKDTTNYNNHAIRIVTGTPSSGGSVDFSTVFGRTATDNYTLTTPDIASHPHTPSGQVLTNTATTGAAGRHTTGSGTPISDTANAGGGGAHAHNIDLRVKYVDAIFATKD